MGSSNHITIQDEDDVTSQMKVGKELEDISQCYHNFVNDNNPLEEKDTGDALPELGKGVKTTIDSLQKVNIGIDEDLRPTYLNTFLEREKKSLTWSYLKEYRDIFSWSYKEVPAQI